MQLTFIHSFENNRESQSHLEDRAEHFEGQCKTVLKLLRSGVRLSVYDAIVVHGISSLPRRIKDLRDGGIVIHDEWVYVDGKRSYKEYFIK